MLTGILVLVAYSLGAANVLLIQHFYRKEYYRVRVETYDGCVTVWYEKSKAKTADKLILNRVYNQLCGLNIKEISVNPSV